MGSTAGSPRLYLRQFWVMQDLLYLSEGMCMFRTLKNKCHKLLNAENGCLIGFSFSAAYQVAIDGFGSAHSFKAFLFSKSSLNTRPMPRHIACTIKCYLNYQQITTIQISAEINQTFTVCCVGYFMFH